MSEPPPMDTVTVKIITDRSGVPLCLPTVIAGAGDSRLRLFPALVRYQRLNYRRSLSWHKALCRAFRLLLEFAAANSGRFSGPQDLFESFSERIRTGTIMNGADPSGLYWRERYEGNAAQLIRYLTEFSRYLTENGYADRELNPLRESTTPEYIMAALAWAHRNQRAFLGHAESRARAWQSFSQHNRLPDGRRQLIKPEHKPRFPEEHFWDLIFKGFARHHGVSNPVQGLDYRGALITLLLHGGGIRLSEAFHIFVRDIEPDPVDAFRLSNAQEDPTAPLRLRALVRIHHPELGYYRWRDPTGKTLEKSRREYLASIGYTPRNLATGGLHSGWKNPTLDGPYYLNVYWSEPAYGTLFLYLWQHYLRQLRNLPRAAEHPWAWVNFQRNAMKPYTYDSYQEAHARAVERIGLNVKKELGTTPHGHRHAYMYRLRTSGVDRVVIQRAAHHHSIESQEVYTREEQTEVRHQIAAGFAKLGTAQRVSLSALEERFESIVGEPMQLE